MLFNKSKVIEVIAKSYAEYIIRSVDMVWRPQSTTTSTRWSGTK